MLFDLNDFKMSGIIGAEHLPANQVYWPDTYTTFRACIGAHLNAVKEFTISAIPLCSIAEGDMMNAKILDIYDSNLVLGPIAKNFWNAMVSLPLSTRTGEFALTVGTRFNVPSVGKYEQSSSYMDYPTGGPTNTWWNDNYKNVAILNTEGEFTYTVMTQELYDAYKLALTNFQSKIKETIVLAEGGVDFTDWVAPLVPAWNSYPELSGYVRGTNNLTIKDAVVRLVDNAGVNHDIVTDTNGFYKFDKEMFYNTITFDHGATASNFNMFVLENTAPTDYSFFFKDNSLYDKTSIFQNSFFGAENNRDFTWPVQVKMGKSLRRNFKLEVRGDYSNYPSFSGYVKDAAGNPIENAFVAIKDPGTGWSIGEYKKPSGYYGMKFTYDDFGTSRSVLTDANGYYEYTSQMVGEWFTKELINDNYIPSGSMMTAHTFNDYFVNTFVTTTDYYSGKILRSNDFVVCLVPYVQDVNNDSISWDGVSIYDRNEYSTSRFKYALNNYNEFFYQEINLDTHYDIDVNISLAVGDEVRADKVFFKLDDRCKEVNNAFPIQLQVGFDNEWAKTPDQRIKIVYPKTGESYMFGRNEDYRYDSSWHLNVNSTNFDDYSEFYFYACDSSGRALGFINLINTQSTNSVIESIDLSGLSCLNRLLIGERFYGDSIDLTGMESLYNFESQSGFIKNIEGMENSINNLFLYNALIETLDISGLTNLDDLRLSNLPLLQSLDLQHNTNLSRINIKNVDVNIDVTGLGRLWSVNYDKITMTSDDIDDLLIQMANNPSPYTDPNDTWSYGRFVEGGSIKFYDEEHGSPRIARSSYSDSAFDILANNRHWSIGLGSGFYPDLIEPKKLVLTVDPNLVDTYSEYLSTNFNVQTSTGYWIGKLLNGRIVGYLPMINLNGSSINETFRLGTENTTIEIYSCDENGIPQGDITSFELSSGFVFSDIDTSELTGLTNLSFYGSGSIESLDLKSNINLDHLVVIGCSSIDSIDVTGLTSLKHINIGNSRLSEVIGFSTLSSLESIDIDGLPNLSYLSFAGLNNIRSIYINEDDLYDSTHVDTMLSELNANSVALIATPLAELDVKQAEINVKYDEKTSLSGIDPSFAYGSGFDGEGGTTLYSTAIQSDGKILVGGYFTTYNGTGANYIIRLNSDGSIDTSFVYGTGFDNSVYSIAIQSNGKILVGGDFTTYNGTSANRIIRLNTDGSIDTSFVYGTGFNNLVSYIAIQSNGAILLGGLFTNYNGTGASQIIRLNSDGSVDTSFVYGTGFNNLVRYIAIQSDDKILVGGDFTDYNGTGATKIIKLNSDGSVDSSFVYGTGFDNSVYSTAIQSDGKILVGGYFTTYNGTGANSIIRLNTDGSIDTSFVYGAGFDYYIFSIAIQSNGKIVCGGNFTSYNGTSASYIIRLNSDGSRDTSFVYGTGFNGSVFSTAIQSNGAILVGGQFTTYNGASANRIVSLNGILGSDEEIAVINEEIVVLEGIITTIQSLINDLNSNNSGRQVNTYYMARTSASDADYDALIAFGWSLNLGGEFIYPYSQPVKGFITIDWDSNENSYDNFNFSNLLRLKSNTGYLKVKSGRYSEKLSVNSDASSGTIDSIYFNAQKGIMEFYSCDSHGRPAGNIIGFGKTGNDSSFIKSFDISNLTDIDRLYFESGFQSVSTMDLSSNINIKSLTITQWNSLESIVGFENLVNLKDIYMGSNTSLDIPVDFSSMVNLQRIYLYDINGINKNSRLNVSGLTKLQSINVSWTNILSVDLDNALLALDAAGLNSESDFSYEGHFIGTYLDFSIGMGIGYHAESASAFTSLQSKGWSLSVGDQIIDSVEEPTKGIVRWANDSTWAAIQFGLESGISVMAKYPNGIQNVGAMINYTFDSNVPVEGRFIEFWAVDSYGRPRHDGITQINEYWNTRITSLELDNIKSTITTISVPSGHAIQSMDLSGFSNLTYFELSNSSTLESVIFTGCSKIRNITFQESPNLNIDAVLESIDSTGSEADFNNWGSNYLYAQKSIATSVSEAFLDSLVDKGWEIYLIEAPSVPMILNVVSGDLIDFNVSSSTGIIRLIFPEGSSMHQQWSDGWTQGSSPFRSINNFGYSNYQFSADFTGQISIISVAQNQNDGSFFNSGKIRYIRNIGQGTFDVNTMGNLKIISMYNPTSVAIAAIANFNLSLLEIDSYSGNSLDLSNHLSKGIRITQTAASILFNNSVLNTLNLNNCTSIDSIDLTGAIMTGAWLYNCQSLTNIELPAVISSLNINNCPLLTGELDLTGCAGLNDLYLNMTSIYSIDITGLSNIFSISLDNTNCDIIGFETTSTKQFTHVNVDKNNYVLAVPTTLEGLNIGSRSIQSLILTQSGGIFKTGTQLVIDDSNTQHGNDPISSIVLPIDKYQYIYLQSLSVLPDLSIMDPGTNLGLYNISTTSIDLQGLSANEVTISGGAFQSINISGNITSGLRLQSTSYTSMDFSNLTSDYILTQSMSLQGPILTRTNQNFTISGGNNINLTGSTLGNVDIQATGVINLSGITANTVKLRYCYNVTSMNFNGSTINNLEMRYTNYENNMPTFQISMVSLVIINTLLIMSNKATSIDATDAAIPYGYIEQNQYLTNFTYSLKGSRVLAMTLNTPLITISLTDSNLNTLLERVEILGSVTLSANVVNSVINSISTSDLTGKTLRLRNMNSRTSVSQTGYTKLVNQSWNMIAS